MVKKSDGVAHMAKSFWFWTIEEQSTSVKEAFTVHNEDGRQLSAVGTKVSINSTILSC